MKNFAFAIITIAIYTSVVAGVSFYVARKTATREATISVIRETPTEHKVLMPNIESLPDVKQQEIFKECYYSQIEIEGILRADVFHIRAANKCQEARKDFILKAEISESGNWKFYAGASVGAILISGAGYCAYKILR
jgi:hypothetical protein